MSEMGLAQQTYKCKQVTHMQLSHATASWKRIKIKIVDIVWLWAVQGSSGVPFPPPLFSFAFPPFPPAGFRFAPFPPRFLFLLRPLLVTLGMRLDLALLYTPKRRRSSRPVGLNMRVTAEWLRRLYRTLRSPTRLISYCWGLKCKHAGTLGE